MDTKRIYTWQMLRDYDEIKINNLLAKRCFKDETNKIKMALTFIRIDGTVWTMNSHDMELKKRTISYAGTFKKFPKATLAIGVKNGNVHYKDIYILNLMKKYWMGKTPFEKEHIEYIDGNSKNVSFQNLRWNHKPNLRGMHKRKHPIEKRGQNK